MSASVSQVLQEKPRVPSSLEQRASLLFNRRCTKRAISVSLWLEQRAPFLLASLFNKTHPLQKREIHMLQLLQQEQGGNCNMLQEREKL